MAATDTTKAVTEPLLMLLLTVACGCCLLTGTDSLRRLCLPFLFEVKVCNGDSECHNQIQPVPFCRKNYENELLAWTQHIAKFQNIRALKCTKDSKA